MASEYRVPWPNRIFRFLFRPLFRFVFRLLSRVTVEGLENVPASGPYLIAINHVSLFEPPFILAFWPAAPEAVGAVDIWERPGQSLLARLYGGIPAHRGEYDRILLDTMQRALQSGRPLVIAPEGGRSHTPGMRRGLPGVAYVIEKTEVPVVPVGVTGATDDFLVQALRGQRPSIHMRIGQALQLPPIRGAGAERRVARQANVDLVMTRIAGLLPVEYQGVYRLVPGDG